MRASALSHERGAMRGARGDVTRNTTVSQHGVVSLSRCLGDILGDDIILKCTAVYGKILISVLIEVAIRVSEGSFACPSPPSTVSGTVGGLSAEKNRCASSPADRARVGGRARKIY